jgi:hypothetical protein
MTKQTTRVLYERVSKDKIDFLLARLSTDVATDNELITQLREFKAKYVKKYKTKDTKYVNLETVYVKYDYAHVVKNIPFGRCYPHNGKNSYCGMQSTLRSFLATEFYNYIDISNCHPRIILDLLNYYQIDSTDMENYCTNRKQILEENDVSKSHVNMICNSANFKFSPKDNELFRNIHQSVFKPDGLCDALINSFPDFYKHFDNYKKKKGEVDNIRGAFASQMFMTFENRIIIDILKYLTSLQYSVDSIIYDGLLINKEKEITEHTLKLCSEYVASQQYMELPIKFNVTLAIDKLEMSEQFKEYISRTPFVKAAEEEEEEGTEDPNSPTDYDVGVHLNKTYADKLFKYKGNIYCKDSNGLWVLDNDAVFDTWLVNCDFDLTPNGKRRNLVKSITKNWNSYKKQLRAHINQSGDDSKRAEKLDKYKDILPFTNKYWDFKKKEYLPLNTEDYYFTKVINLEIPEDIDAVEYDEAYEHIERIILSMFDDDKEIINQIFSYFARALSGHVEDKFWLSLQGLRNSGKGVLISMFQMSFSNFIGMIDASELTLKKSNESVERRNGFLDKFVDYVITFCSEAEANSELDGKMLKTIASGGDFIPSYRSAYKTEKSGYIRASLCICSQNLPIVNPTDAMQNLLCYDMPCTYVKSESEVVEGGAYKVKLGDDTLKDLFHKPEYKIAFIKYVFNFYQPTCPDYTRLKLNNKDNLADLGVSDETYEIFVSVFDDNFMVTNNKKDMLLTKKVLDIVKVKIQSISAIRLHKFMQTLMKDKNPKCIYLKTTENRASKSVFTNLIVKPPPVPNLIVKPPPVPKQSQNKDDSDDSDEDDSDDDLS